MNARLADAHGTCKIGITEPIIAAHPHDIFGSIKQGSPSIHIPTM